MRALGRLVRGLSAIFWGLPLTLVVGIQTARTEWLGSLGVFPLLVATSLLFYGLLQMGYFRQEERIWMEALFRAKILALTNIGLSPFLFWWHRFPHQTWFTLAVSLLALSSLLYLFDLNHVLQRLAAMLPDETLRQETRMFTTLNTYLLLAAILLLASILAIAHSEASPRLLVQIRLMLDRQNLWLSVLLVLLPVAMTMALIWKIKETIFSSLFSAEG